MPTRVQGISDVFDSELNIGPQIISCEPFHFQCFERSVLDFSVLIVSYSTCFMYKKESLA